LAQGFDKFALGATTDAIHRFWQEDFCDVLLEAIKPVFTANADQARIASMRQTLFTCVDEGLRLLHPFMPFITEELWQRLPRRAAFKATESICITSYPVPVRLSL
jgi:valyl-tRNA synthetase